MVGQTISHYKILEKLGAGGMGVVYKAEDTKLKRMVALKFLPADLTRDEETRKRFIQEAQAASALEHNNICNIHEINETEDGQLYIVMAHYEGETLKDKIGRAPLELDEALNITTQIGQGLARAHEADIIHRDIKPANIITTERNEVKIVDFGLAKLGGQTRLTKMGTILGTVAYMSPEQASGMATDHRTDIWALGVVLYEAITGQLPFKGEYDMALMYAIMNEDPQPLTQILPELPLGLEKVINKALAKEPGERYQDVNEMLNELGTVVKGKGEQPLSATTTRFEGEATSSLFKTLFERRIPQILGLYFGASFGIMQFLQLLVEQYPISPHLPQFSFVTLVSMLPTVYLLAHFHGKPGRDRWTRFEKIGIPINLLVSAVLLFFLFQDKDLGAATKTVSIKDEEGNTLERTIPKSEFRKKIAMFFFENVLDDSTLNWLQYGIPDLLESDLSQDLVFDIKSGFVSELKEAGFHELVGSPLTLKKKISKEKYLNYFVTGNFRKQHDTLYVTTTLYETKRSKLLAESSFKGTNIFKLVDLISVQLKRDLEIPGFHIEETEDQPLSEMLTNSIPAYRMFIASLIALVINSNEDASLKYLEQAVEEDSTFAYAQYRLHSGYTFSSQSEKAQKALQATMQHIYKLPERVQFRVKYDYYAMKADPDKQLALSKMWTEVYPDDIEGHDFLADVYLTRNQLDEAILEYKQILELDPTQYEYLQRIGMLHRQNDQNEEALNYYKNYAEQFPTDHRSFKAIGNFYKTQGDYGPAIYYLEKALLIEPEEISVLLKLAEIKSTFGHYKQALKQYHDAIKISKSPEHRMEVNRILEEFYLMRGQMGKLLEHMHLRLEDEEKMFPSLMVLISKLLFSLDKYIMAGEKDVAFQTIQDIEAQLKAPYDKLIPIGYLFIYLELEDADKAEQVLGEIEPFTQTDFYTMYGLDIPHLKAMG